MVNNDVLKKIRYISDYGDNMMIETFGKGGLEVDREKVSQWLKKDDDADYVLCRDKELAAFLNGFIIQRRGQREGDTEAPKAESKLSNNLTFRKIMIAFSLKTDEVINVLETADFRLSKHELSAFFRKPTHKNYRDCKSQVLRNFLMGLQLKEVSAES